MVFREEFIDNSKRYLEVKCKICGWKNHLYTEKKICKNCGNFVFINDKKEFNYRIREAINEKNKC